MIKKLISPLQTILLQKKMCPGCTTPLEKGVVSQKSEHSELLTCQCGRIFVHERKLDTYRRALPEEL